MGRAIVEDALRSGAQVTLCGPGKTGAGLFPGVTRLRGDRDTGDYAALRERTWDAAGMPATPLEVTVADALAWDCGRGEPPLEGGFTRAGAGAGRPPA